MKKALKENHEKIELEEDLQLLESILKSKSDIKRGNVISHEEVKKRLGYKDTKWKENA